MYTPLCFALLSVVGIKWSIDPYYLQLFHYYRGNCLSANDVAQKGTI